MKKFKAINYCKLSMIVCVLSFGISLASCSSDVENNVQPEEINEEQNTKITTSFSKDDFNQVLNEIAKGFNKGKSRSSNDMTEENANLLIMPLTKDGEYLRKMILEDENLSISEKDSLNNMSDAELAFASLTINLLMQKECYSRSSGSKSDTCLFNAISGLSTGGSFMGWGAKTISKALCKRILLAGIGGFVGGAIYIAWTVWEYKKCMGYEVY